MPMLRGAVQRITVRFRVAKVQSHYRGARSREIWRAEEARACVPEACDVVPPPPPDPPAPSPPSGSPAEPADSTAKVRARRRLNEP